MDELIRERIEINPEVMLGKPVVKSCDFGIVRALRADGYDVLAVSEFTDRSVDRELIEQAHREQRIRLTEDKDFGWLVFVSHLPIR